MPRPTRPVLAAALVAASALFALPACQPTSSLSQRPNEEPRAHAMTNSAADPLGSDALARIEAKQTKTAVQGAKRADQPAEAMEFYLQQRLAPGMTTYPMDRVSQARDEIMARQRLRGPASPGGISSWEELGPGNIGGRTRAIVVDPTDTDTIYAAGVGGGVFKTTDGGASWTPTDDSLVNIAVCSLVMDPTDPDTLYAGTGEGFFNGDAIRGLGIFKTTNAGVTWTQLSSTVDGSVASGAFYRVNALAISANDADRIYAATRFGVYRSTNAGASWQQVLDNPQLGTDGGPTSNGSFVGATDLAVRTDTNPDTIFAAFGSFTPDGLFRSTDGGTTWTQVGVGVLDVFNQGRMNIEIAPSNQNIMYVGMADNGSGNDTGRVVDVFRSTDGGTTWTPRLNPAGQVAETLYSNTPFAISCTVSQQFISQGWYDNAVAVDPFDPDTVYVGGIDLFRSTDGGQNFSLLSYWYFSPGSAEYVHADQHTIVFDPNYNGTTNQRVYVGNDGGVFRTDNINESSAPTACPFVDDGKGGFVFDDSLLPDIVWEELNNGYGVTQYYHGDSASMRDTFVGGAQDNGTSLVTSTGNLNGWERAFGGDGGYCAVDHQNNDIIFAQTQNFPTIVVSFDAGDSFQDATNGITDTDGLFISPFAMDPSDSSILFTGGSRAWRTTDGAANWQLVSDNFDGPATISAIASAPSDSNVVYLGFSDGYVVRSANALAANPAWDIFDDSNGLPAEAAFISSVAVHPTNPSIAFATTSTFDVDHIYLTVDAGQTWNPIDGIADANIPDIPVHWIAVRPCEPTSLYAGTEVGVFVSDDAGTTWAPANFGFPTTVVETLDFQNDNTLVAFTHGRGAFRAVLAPCATPACPGDTNTTGTTNGVPDGEVNLSDLQYFLTIWQNDLGISYGSDADINTTGTTNGISDGEVNLTDLQFFLTQWQTGLSACP